MYKIVQANLLDFVLVQVDTLEKAKERLEEMKKTDRYLAKYYGWKELPIYKIIKEN